MNDTLTIYDCVINSFSYIKLKKYRTSGVFWFSTGYAFSLYWVIRLVIETHAADRPNNEETCIYQLQICRGAE